MDKKITLIMNPCAGTRKGAKLLSDIVALFNSYGYITTVFMTEKRSDATVFTEKYCDDADIVVVAGGDGTFNEAIEGMMNSKLDIPIGYIPCGSTNDFARSLKLSSDAVQAAEDIALGTPRRLDIGQIGSRYFTYVASFGAFTKASYSTPQSVKNALGHIAYILEGIKDIPSIQPIHAKLAAAEQSFEGDYLFGAISNSTSLGGVLTLNEEIVDMNDGIFEIMLIKSPENPLQLQQILSALSEKNYDTPMIDFAKSSFAKLSMKSNTDWSLDGEYYAGESEVKLINMHGAIRLIVNDK